MAENAPRWPMMIGTYLEVEGCLGAALVGLLGGDMDFKIVDGFVMALETGFTFVLVNVNGLGGRGEGAVALRESIDSNRSFPVMSTLRIDFTAFEIFRHMLDFKSSVSCLVRIRVAYLWLGNLDYHICYKFC